MSTLSGAAPFQYYVLAAAFTVIKLVTLAFATIAVRTRSKKTTLPEDSKFAGSELVASEPDGVDRVQRMHRNALENELPFLAIGLVYVMTGGSPRGALIYFGVFVGARFLHSVFFAMKLQPLRSIMFVVGALALLGLSVSSILKVLG